jgi:hypothetical protein
MNDLVKSLAWPVVIGGCFIFICIFFRKQIGALLSRTTSVGKDGLKALPPINGKICGFESDQDPAIPCRGLRFMITTPLSGFATQEKYDEFMDKMKTVVRKIKALKHVDKVYYFNEAVPTIGEFYQNKWSVPAYLNEIDQCDYLIVIIPTSSVSSVYFESGYALGKSIKTIYFVGPDGKVPSLMWQCGFTFPKLVRCQSFSSLGEVPELLGSIMPVLHQED